MAHNWADKLKEDKVQEFSFYPHAYTPLKEERGFALPPVEAEFGGGDDEGSGDPQDRTPSWVKNLSFTIGGITIGAAAVYGLLGLTPPPAQPACTPTVVEKACPTPAKPTMPATTGRPATTTSAATPATGTTTSTSTNSAGTL